MTGTAFNLKKELFKKEFGFGIDFGSSGIKVAYTTVEDDNLRVHLQTFSSSNQAGKADCFKFLAELCKGHMGDGMKYSVTGVNMSPYLKEFGEMLNISPDLDSENSYIVDGFRFMTKYLSWEEFVFAPEEEARNSGKMNSLTVSIALEPAEHGLFTLGRSEVMKYSDLAERLPEERKVRYPVILCVNGSGTYIFKLEENGFYKIIDGNPVAGKTLLGLGNLLTGAKNFGEIIDLAIRGNSENMDVTLGGVCSVADDPTYAPSANVTRKLFSFGKAAQGEDIDSFSKEDVAAGLLSMINVANARDVYFHCIIEDVQQVFFVGGIPANSELARKNIEREFFAIGCANSKEHVAECFFVKGGSHAGAIGCLVKNLELITEL